MPAVEVIAIIPPTVPTGLNADEVSLTDPKAKLYTLLVPGAPTISRSVNPLVFAVKNFILEPNSSLAVGFGLTKESTKV